MNAHYGSAADLSRRGRHTSNDALALLEDALGAPTPSREHAWLEQVMTALDSFIAALDKQAESDLGDLSLLSEIGRDHPRLLPRVGRLHAEHSDLRDAATSLRDQIRPTNDNSDIDTADTRDRLSSIARRFRQHRAREADLVYEAINVDLGAGD